jgi:hypothetical protein
VLPPPPPPSPTPSPPPPPPSPARSPVCTSAAHQVTRPPPVRLLHLKLPHAPLLGYRASPLPLQGPAMSPSASPTPKIDSSVTFRLLRSEHCHGVACAAVCASPSARNAPRRGCTLKNAPSPIRWVGFRGTNSPNRRTVPRSTINHRARQPPASTGTPLSRGLAKADLSQRTRRSEGTDVVWAVREVRLARLRHRAASAFTHQQLERRTAPRLVRDLPSRHGNVTQ